MMDDDAAHDALDERWLAAWTESGFRQIDRYLAAHDADAHQQHPPAQHHHDGLAGLRRTLERHAAWLRAQHPPP